MDCHDSRSRTPNCYTQRILHTPKYLDWLATYPFSYRLLPYREPRFAAQAPNTILVTVLVALPEPYRAFYALFALLLFLPRRMFLIAGGAIFVAGLTSDAAGIEIPPWATVATNPLLLEFYLGAIIAFLFIRGYYLPPSLASRNAPHRIARHRSHRDHQAIQARQLDCDRAAFVCWARRQRSFWSSAILLEKNAAACPTGSRLSRGRKAAFSLYLVHIFVVAALAEAWAYCHLTTIMPDYVLGLTCFAAALAVSHLVHLQIEYPLNKWLKAAISGPASKQGLPQRVSHRH